MRTPDASPGGRRRSDRRSGGRNSNGSAMARPPGPHRLLVAEDEDRIVGYAASTRFKTRAAYATSVESTIYLDSNESGRGTGALLYGALIDQLIEEPSVHRVYAGIALPNDASVALHRRLGFEHVGSYHEVGYKFDKYWDVDWYEKDAS